MLIPEYLNKKQFVLKGIQRTRAAKSSAYSTNFLDRFPQAVMKDLIIFRFFRIPEITNITMPKLKVDIEREERLAAKREFAYKLAEMQAMMAQSDSDSSDSDRYSPSHLFTIFYNVFTIYLCSSFSSDSDSESDSDSDYETQKSSSTGSLSPTDITTEAKVEKVFKLPTNVKIAPAPKPGMVLVKRKRSRLDIEEENAKKLKTEKLKILEMTKCKFKIAIFHKHFYFLKFYQK